MVHHFLVFSVVSQKFDEVFLLKVGLLGGIITRRLVKSFSDDLKPPFLTGYSAHANFAGPICPTYNVSFDWLVVAMLHCLSKRVGSVNLHYLDVPIDLI